MPFLAPIFERLGEKRYTITGGQTLTSLISWLTSGSETASGVEVTPEGSLSCTAVLAAVQRISESIAMLALPVYRRDAERSRKKKRAPDHPLYEILHDNPNPEITSIEFRSMMQASILVRGNGYAEIERDTYGNIRGLWPLRSDRMRVMRKGGKIWYLPTINGKEYALPKERVFHIKGFSTYGIVGLSLLETCKEAIGTAQAQEQYHGRFFGNNAQPRGVLEHPGHLSENASKNLRTSWEQVHTGLSNAHRVAILEEGMAFKQTGVSNEDAQMIAGRIFSIQEIARIFNIPPHLIGELTHATFTNIEHQGLEYVTFTLGPWLVRWEQRIGKDLFTPEERKIYFAEHLVDTLLRADAKTRGEFYRILWGLGSLSPNEIRDLENMNTQGDAGDKYYVPLNFTPVEGDVAETPIDDDTEGTRGVLPNYSVELRQDGSGERLRLREVWKPIFLDAAGRLVRAEIRDISQAIKKHFTRDAQSFDDWLQEYYADQGAFYGLVHKIMAGPFNSYTDELARAAALQIDEDIPEMEEFKSGYATVFAARHGGSSIGQIRKIFQEEQEAEAELDARLERWNTNRAEKISDNETVRLAEAAAKTVFVFYGYKLIWRTSGSACPLCSLMEGRVMGRDGVFLPAGGRLDPNDGETAPLTVSSNVGHAPLHAGCVCYVNPE